MAKVSKRDHEEFLDYFRDQHDFEDTFIKICGAPLGFMGWACSWSTLELFLQKADITRNPEYNEIPFFAEGFAPVNGATPLETAKNAVEAYLKVLQDPAHRKDLNLGYINVVESLRYRIGVEE